MCSEPDCTCLSPSLSTTLLAPDSIKPHADAPTFGRSSSFAEGRSGDGADGAADVGEIERGMVLPFQPLAMTFDDMHYFVDVPAVGGSRPTWGCHGELCEGGANCRTDVSLHRMQAQLQPAAFLLIQSGSTPSLCKRLLHS